MLQRLLGGMRPQVQSNNLVAFKSYVGVQDGDDDFDTQSELAAIINNSPTNFTKLWELTVPAQQMIRWGSGSAVAQRNQGYLWFAAVDESTGFEEGIFRLVLSNARETRTLVVAELDTRRTHTQTNTTLATATPTDINEMIALPEQVQFPAAGEDSKLQLFWKTVSATTTVDAVGFSIPITVYQ